MAVRWGILGCGVIANDFCTAMRLLPHGEHTVVAVAARDVDNPETFAKKYEIQKSYTKYENIATDPDIEIAYVAVVNTEHIRLATIMLEHGKHVLCEKPMATNSRDCQELISLAKRKNLFLMEGMWSRCTPAYKAIRKSLCNKEIGEIRLLQATICQPIDKIPRIRCKELAGGALYDLGIYCLMLGTMVFDERPTIVNAVGNLFDTGVDMNGCVTLRYSGGKFLQMYYDVGVQCPNNFAQIIGTDGHIELETPFWAPTKVKTPTGVSELDLKDDLSRYNCQHSELLKYEISEIRRCLQEGLTECPLMTHRHSLIMSQTLEDIRQKLGVEFPGDD